MELKKELFDANVMFERALRGAAIIEGEAEPSRALKNKKCRRPRLSSVIERIFKNGARKKLHEYYCSW